MTDRLNQLLRRFQKRSHSYSGSGTIEFSSGRKQQVHFAATQQEDGTNVIVCEYYQNDWMSAFNDIFSAAPAAGLAGVTSEGERFETEGALRLTDVPGRLPTHAGTAAFSAYAPRVMRVQSRPGSPASIHYGLTNLRPPGIPSLPIHLAAADINTEVRIVRLSDYESRFDAVRILGETAVTCEIVLPSSLGSLSDIQSIVEDISYILSVAQGSKVQWIYREERANGHLLVREHCMRKTQPYCPLPLIELRTLNGPRRFVELTYPTYARRRDGWGFNTGTIDTYLEAKSEADYLETRGVKLAVTLETLKHRYLRSGEASLAELVLDGDRFSELLPAIRANVQDALVRGGITAAAAGRVANKVRGLNRESFSRIIQHLASDLQLHITSKERRQVIDSRNALVHQGQFYCQAVAKREMDQTSLPLPTPAAEYFFVLAVLDQILLKLLGYSGEYVDWRTVGAPTLRQIQ